MVISFISYKGGVGKTTMSENVAVCFAHAGRSVCIVDADDSANSISWVARRDTELPKIDVYRENNKEEIDLNIQEYNKRKRYINGSVTCEKCGMIVDIDDE